MATIPENLEKIKTARYGEEVRGAIHDSIEDIYGYANGEKINTLDSEIFDQLGYIQPFQMTFDRLGYIDTTGYFNKTNAKTFSTDFVKVRGYRYVRYKGRIAEAGYRVAFFNSNKEFISGSLGDNSYDEIIIKIPDNAYYVCASYFSDSLSETKMSSVALCELLAFYKPFDERMDESGYINVNGEVSDLQKAVRTDYIPTKFYDAAYVLSGLNNQGFIVAYFDENKDLIENISINTNDSGVKIKNFYFTVNKSASYFVVSGYKISYDVDYFIRLYSRYDIPFSQKKDVSGNVYGELDLIGSSVIDSGNRLGVFKFSGNYEAYRTSGLIPTDGFKSFILWSGINKFENACIFLDESMHVIGTVKGADSDAWYRVYSGKIPENSKYVIFNSYRNNSPRYILKTSEDTLPNVLILGDSITDCVNISEDTERGISTSYRWNTPSGSYNDGSETIHYNMWPKLLYDSGLIGYCRNYAKFGARWITFDGLWRQSLQNQITLAINDSSDPIDEFEMDSFVPDIIIIAIGTNDYLNHIDPDTYEEAIGKIVRGSDGNYIDWDTTISSLDDTKFNQAMLKAYLRLKREWPFAQIYTVLPIQRTAGDIVFSEKHDMQEKMANRMSSIVIDGAKEMGIVPEGNKVNSTNGTTLKDGLHPNRIGQMMMYRTIAKSIESHYIPYQDIKEFL